METNHPKLFWFFWLILIAFVTFMLMGCSTQKEVVYTTIYPQLQPLQKPNVLSLKACEWTYPLVKDDKVFVGLDESNFKCYIENKEIIREQMKLYDQFVDQVNKERSEWNKLNSKK